MKEKYEMPDIDFILEEDKDIVAEDISLEEEVSVEIVKEEKEEVLEKEGELKITTTRVNLRKEPNGKILKVLEKGETLIIVDTKDDWSITEEGAYIMSAYIK